MAGANIVETQLQTGEFELTTVGSAVQDSGIIDVTLEEGEQGGEDSVQGQNRNPHGDNPSNKKCHQGTQTEFLSCFVVIDIKKVSEPVEDNHFEKNCKLHGVCIHGPLYKQNRS